MDACASKSGDLATPKPEVERATSCCSEFVTAQIELSKRHWSELSKPVADCISVEEAAIAKLDNQEVFKRWQSHPKWSRFFYTFGYSLGVRESVGSLEVGEKFAEGAQAELFHVRIQWRNLNMNEQDLEEGIEWVLKVFKEGTLVRDLQLQWPHGLFRIRVETWERAKLGKPIRGRDYCDVFSATLLEDGRFAFLMVKEHEDLRSLIERKMAGGDHGCGPFSKEVGEEIMYRVARGMNRLHSYDIVHRDLKASNVLVTTSVPRKYLYCFVADFESSIGVVGTGFWRAPEILQACKERSVGKKPEVFSKQADSYSFGMTCYEVLTGRVPFQDHPLSDECSLLMDLVIDHHLRPEVPEYVDAWAGKLLHWCWQRDPKGRPSFKEIIGFLEANANSDYIQERASERSRAECAAAEE